MISLLGRADSDTEPLWYEAEERLDDGETYTRGGTFNRRLKTIRQPVKVTISGGYVPAGGRGGRDPIRPWSKTYTLHFPMSPSEFWRNVRERIRSAFFSPGRGTPPELYLYDITYREPTWYEDTVTGEEVSKETWKRSRRAIRAAAKKKGKRPRTGRYVRHSE